MDLQGRQSVGTRFQKTWEGSDVVIVFKIQGTQVASRQPTGDVFQQRTIV